MYLASRPSTFKAGRPSRSNSTYSPLVSATESCNVSQPISRPDKRNKYSRQSTSSSFKAQSNFPSHLLSAGMHAPLLPQWNSSSAHVPEARERFASSGSLSDYHRRFGTCGTAIPLVRLVVAIHVSVANRRRLQVCQVVPARAALLVGAVLAVQALVASLADRYGLDQSAKARSIGRDSSSSLSALTHLVHVNVDLTLVVPEASLAPETIC